MKRNLLPLVIALPLPAQAPTHSDLRDQLQAEVRAHLEAARAEHGFPGACAAFVLPDGEVGQVAVGFVDPEEKLPLTTEHRMFSGSIGKTYVAAVALQLCGEGVLDLDAKVSEYLGGQEWFAAVPNGGTMTVRMLLNHTSGVPEHVWKREFHEAVAQHPDKEWSPGELVAFVAGDEPLFEAGQGWSYADTNYVLVGAVMEQATGKSWYRLLRERLLQPLKLEATGPSDGRDIPDLANGWASGVALHEGPTVVEGRYFVNPQFEWCGGGVCSTTADLARWGRALFAGEVVPEPLRKEQLEGIEARRIGGKYGLGVIVRDTDLGPSWGHTGIMVGYLSAMAFYPEQDLVVAMQLNTDDGRKAGKNPQRYADEIAALLARKLQKQVR